MERTTIYAPITPVGVSACGVIRVSGEKTFEIIDKIFSKPVSEILPNYATHGFIFDGGKTVDDVVLTLYKAPKSYTGEDVAEISCHGSLYVLSAVQKLLAKNGAVLAKGGEFSKRAFMNGKIDVIKAEAIIDLIEAETEKEASLSLSHIKGRLSDKINLIRENLLALSANLLAYIDYPDDDIEDVTSEKIKNTVNEAFSELSDLEKSYENGRLIKNGVKVSIVGKANVGKSMLLNCLSGRERSIVTDIAGTTRDVIEETVNLSGYRLRLFDTAGIRESDDKVEKIGVEKAEEEIKKADLVFCVFDLSRPFDKDDERILSLMKNSDAKKIAIFNKCDETAVLEKEKISGIDFDKEVNISAKERLNIGSLEEAVKSLLSTGVDNKEMIMNQRQYDCILSALSSLSHAKENSGLTPDVILTDIEDTIESLSLMTGKSVSEEILSNIFSRFCVGK